MAKHSVRKLPVSDVWANPEIVVELADHLTANGWTLISAYVIESHLHMLFRREKP